MNNKIIYPINNANEILINKLCVGIDLGTTTTVTCVVDSSDVNLNKSLTVPVKHINVQQQSPSEYDNDIYDSKVASIVAFSNGKTYVGSNLYHLKGRPGFDFKKNIFYHWKLELGIDHHPMYPNAISEKVDMPYKIAGGILNYVKKVGLKKDTLENTIITVPASFQANQRNDVIKAANMAKIKISDQMLIDEPNAAFLGYFNRLPDDEKSVWSHSVRNSNVLIVDFGGGTLDLSILNVDFKYDTGIAISNIAISRYNDLGGQDLDMLLAEEFLFPKYAEKNERISAAPLSDLNNIILPQIANIAEKLKIGICQKINIKIADKLASEVNLDDVVFKETLTEIQYNGETIALEPIIISANEFETYFSKLFNGNDYKFAYQDKSVTCISKSINLILEKAELGLNEINFVLFAGGSSFNPFLGSMIKQKLRQSNILLSHEPDKLIAEGAAVYSYFYYVHGISLITPITSETIGITLAGNRFFPIIERGKALPQKISLPSFQLQTNLNNQILVPICINGNDFPIGEIRADLKTIYDIDSVVRIEAELNTDKVFKMQVYINDDYIGDANFDNPYSIGKISEEEKELFEMKSNLNSAIQQKNFQNEKKYQRDIIWKYSDVKNYKGCLEAAENYSNRFDDQDEYVWNMQYIANQELGRLDAAKRCLDHSLQINPNEGSLIYNYSILIQTRDGYQAALEYLENNVSKDPDYQDNYLRIIILKDKLGEEMAFEAKIIVEKYKTDSVSFSHFSRKNILPNIFEIAGEPYSYVDPKKIRSKEDEGKFLKSSDLPVNLDDLPF